MCELELLGLVVGMFEMLEVVEAPLFLIRRSLSVVFFFCFTPTPS